MHGRQITRLFSSLLLFPALMASAETRPCEAESGPNRVALLELYTSEGCSSCPPADAWLSRLEGQGITMDKLVPLSLHVDYWNYIGWRDPYSSAQYTARQREVGQRNRLRSIYTPQMVFNGRDYRGWRGGDIHRQVIAVNNQPAAATIQLKWSELGEGTQSSLSIKLRAELSADQAPAQPVVHIALFENHLVSHVDAGENDGRSLKHDYVVRRLFNYPFADGRRVFSRQFSLPMNKDWDRDALGLAVFVQDSRRGEVLQAMAQAIDCK